MKHRLLAIVVGLGFAFLPLMVSTPANAAACDTAPTYTAPSACSIQFSLTVESQSTLQFSNINASFGNVLDGTQGNIPGGIAGSITTNASAVLSVYCDTSPFPGLKKFTLQFGGALGSGNNGLSADDCSAPHTLVGSRTANAGTTVFSDSPNYELLPNEGPAVSPGVYTQTVYYELV